jgi:hypothetical protein
MHSKHRLFVLAIASLAAYACSGPSPLSPPITLTLQNDLAASVFVQRGPCGSNEWLTLVAKDGTNLSPAGSGTCAGLCGQPRVECPAIACIAPSAEEVKAGEQMSEKWDGLYEEYQQQQGCFDRFQASGVVTAKFCWGDAPIMSSPNQVDQVRCKSLDFNVARGVIVSASTASN